MTRLEVEENSQEAVLPLPARGFRYSDCLPLTSGSALTGIRGKTLCDGQHQVSAMPAAA